ncbi:DHHW family protein [Fusibacter bizertensis]
MRHKINSILFVIVVLSVGFLNIIFHTENAVSELENKELQLFPEISLKAVFEDQLTSKIDRFVSDQFMFRTPLIKFSSKVSSLSGFKSDMTISVVSNDNMISNFVNDTGQGSSGSSLKASNGGGKDNSANTVDNQTYEVGDIDVNYLVFEDRAFASFDENKQAEREYSDAIKNVSNRFENVNFSVLLTPTQVAFLNKTYDGLTDNQVDSLKRFETLFGSGVQYVNAYPLLKENYSDDLFFRTDHHWNGLGAYYGYLSYCEAKSLQPMLRKDTVYGEVKGFLGSVYKMMNNQNLAKHPDKIMTYTPKIDVSMDRYKVVGDETVIDVADIPYLISEKLMGDSASYRVFLGGDCALTVIHNLDDPSLPKLLVVKDSYGNALVPFLAANYSEIYAVDPRHYVGDLTELIDEKEIKEVLFINSANITRTSGYAGMILRAFE